MAEENELKDEEMINPSDIILEEEDEAMPEPETFNYSENAQDKNANIGLVPTYKFMKLFEEGLGKMAYASVLKNSENKQIKLIDLIRFVEEKQAKMTVADMNTIISFIANCPMEYVRPLMEIIDDAKRQSELWTLVRE